MEPPGGTGYHRAAGAARKRPREPEQKRPREPEQKRPREPEQKRPREPEQKCPREPAPGLGLVWLHLVTQVCSLLRGREADLPCDDFLRRSLAGMMLF